MKRALLFNQLTSDGGVPVITPPEGWELSTVGTKSEALVAMGAANFNAVVAACMTPTEDAVNVLVQAKTSTPSSARLLVTADPGNSPTVSLNRVAHEHLMTPLTQESFVEACERASSMHQHLANVRLRSAMANVKGLPAFPRLYNRIIAELEDGGDLSRIADIVLQDPGLTARVLQLVNSPFYGLRRQVHDTSQAVGLLGIQNLLSMVLAMEVFSEFDASRTQLNISKMWNHAAVTALWAKRIMEAEGRTREEANMAFVAGMLHDSGRMIMASNFPQQHASFLEQIEEDQETPFIEIERSTLGASHAEAGAYLLDTWELPSPIVEAVAYHHEPSLSTCARFTPLTAVHVAEVFQAELGADGIENQLDLDMVYLEKVGLNGRIDAWREACELDLA